MIIIQLQFFALDGKVRSYLLFNEDYIVSNIAITDFCIVIEQESMSKPVFWHLMFKGFLVVSLFLLNTLHLKCRVGQAEQTGDAETTYYS